MNRKVRGIFMIVIALCLSGCVAAVVAGAAGSMVVYDRRTVTVIEKDARIFYVAHRAMVTNPRLQTSHVIITSFNQCVLLTGQVPYASLKSLAESIVKQAPGVHRVYNALTVGPVSSLAERAEDTWISGQVRSRMLTQQGLESGSIRLITEQGSVYLMGIVTAKQAASAVRAAREADGVEKVVKVFQRI